MKRSILVGAARSVSWKKLKLAKSMPGRANSMVMV